MAYIDLDVCYGEEDDGDGTLEWTLTDMLELAGLAPAAVSTEVINPCGSGGGWPVVRFSGEWADLAAIVRNYAADEEDAAYHMRRLVDG